MRKVIALSILIVIAYRSAAFGQSANEMLPGCKTSVSDTPRGFQAGFCLGVIIGLEYAGEGREICKPREATRKQMLHVVIHYIEQQPERMHEQFSLLAAQTLFIAWPCH